MCFIRIQKSKSILSNYSIILYYSCVWVQYKIFNLNTEFQLEIITREKRIKIINVFIMRRFF